MNELRGINRRSALAALGAVPMAGLAPEVRAAEGDAPAPPDQPRELTSAEADMGALYPDIERLVTSNRPSHSFLDSRLVTKRGIIDMEREVDVECTSYAL